MSEFQLFDPLDAATEAALRASIEKFGVLSPVTRDQHGNILDGHHRVRLAEELGIGIADDVVIHVKDDGEAREIARTLNADRRHLTPEQRRENAVELRRDGHSYRSIAGALGVSHTQVRKDVEAAQVETGFHLETGHTKGLDGKTYPSTRPAPPPAPAPDSRPTEPELFAGAEWSAAPEPAPAPNPVEHGDATTARLDAELDAAMEGTTQRFRANFARASVRAGEIATFDPDRVAEVFAANYSRDVGDLLRRLREWCDAVDSAHRRQSSGLRIIHGGTP